MDKQTIQDKLKQQPMTYNMLLGRDNYVHDTKEQLCSRNINKLKKDGTIGSTYLSGILSNKFLFYSMNKKYNIVIALKHRQYRYFYFNKYKKEILAFIMFNAKELVDNKWVDVGNEVIFKGDVIKWL